VSNKDIGKIKSPLDRLFEKENGGGRKRMKGRKIEEMGVPSTSRGLYMHNIGDIMPKSYLRSNADIPKLAEIAEMSY